MNVDTGRRLRWAFVAALLGAILAAAVLLLTDDVIWTLVPILLSVAVIRGLLRRDSR